MSEINGMIDAHADKETRKHQITQMIFDHVIRNLFHLRAHRGSHISQSLPARIGFSVIIDEGEIGITIRGRGTIAEYLGMDSKFLVDLGQISCEPIISMNDKKFLVEVCKIAINYQLSAIVLQSQRLLDGRVSTKKST